MLLDWLAQHNRTSSPLLHCPHPKLAPHLQLHRYMSPSSGNPKLRKLTSHQPRKTPVLPTPLHPLPNRLHTTRLSRFCCYNYCSCFCRTASCSSGLSTGVEDGKMSYGSCAETVARPTEQILVQSATNSFFEERRRAGALETRKLRGACRTKAELPIGAWY